MEALAGTYMLLSGACIPINGMQSPVKNLLRRLLDALFFTENNRSQVIGKFQIGQDSTCRGTIILCGTWPYAGISYVFDCLRCSRLPYVYSYSPEGVGLQNSKDLQLSLPSRTIVSTDLLE